ncbi:MAG: hypothetical protein KDD51_13330 [Bdellovibrionales bacterium]|nr:hypothetical protein [Bdellovibrionales bacterium]
MRKPILLVGAFLTLFLGLSQPAFSNKKAEPAHEAAAPQAEQPVTTDSHKLPELKEDEVPQAAVEEAPVAPTTDEASE